MCPELNPPSHLIPALEACFSGFATGVNAVHEDAKALFGASQ